MVGGEGGSKRLDGAPRTKLFQPTELRDEAGARRAHLLDVSATDVLLHADQPPATGGVVQVGLCGAMRPAVVMWVDAKRVGLSWRVPMDEAQLADVADSQRTFVAEATARLAARG